MTKEQFQNRLWKLDITPTNLEAFFNEVLEKEDDSLKYIEHVRRFFNEKEIGFSCGDMFSFNLFRTMISFLFAYRTSGGYDPSPVAFHSFMPRPSKEAISMAEWYSSQKKREQMAKSDKRRGFYKEGRPTQDCGVDLQEYLYIYEHKTKREEA